MWLYPAPVVIALSGWTFVFATSGTTVIGFGLLSLGIGVAAYLIWQRTRRRAESIP
jgi:hypothetical protein